MRRKDFLVISFEDKFLRILEMAKGKEDFYVTNLFYEEVEADDYVGAMHLVSTMYPVKGRDAFIIWPTKKVFSSLLKLPPMNRREARLAIYNELRDMVPFTGEFNFDFVVSKGEMEDLYFVVAVEREDVETTVSRLETLGVRIKGVITKELAIQGVFKEYVKDLGITGFLHIFDGTGSFYIFKDGNVLLSRSFSLPHGEEIGAIREEVLRSIQYLKQFMRNFVMSEIFILAPPEYKIAYEEILPIPMKIRDIIEEDLLSKLPLSFSTDIQENINEFLLKFMPLLGYALIQETKRWPNLLHEDYIYGKKISSSIVVFLLEILLSAGLVGVGIYLLNSYRQRSEKEMQNIMKKYTSIELKLQELNSVKAKRMEIWKRYYDLYARRKHASIVGEIIKDFSENAPINTVFDSITFQFQNTKVKFEIAGAIFERPGPGNQHFLAYFDRMKSLYPNIIFAELKNVMEADPFFPDNRPIPKVKFIIRGEKEVNFEVK